MKTFARIILVSSLALAAGCVSHIVISLVSAALDDGLSMAGGESYSYEGLPRSRGLSKRVLARMDVSGTTIFLLTRNGWRGNTNCVTAQQSAASHRQSVSALTWYVFRSPTIKRGITYRLPIRSTRLRPFLVAIVPDTDVLCLALPRLGVALTNGWLSSRHREHTITGLWCTFSTSLLDAYGKAMR